MKSHWVNTKLGDVYDVRDGTHDSPKYHPQGYPLITSKNLKCGELNYEKVKFISKEDYLNINKRSKVHKRDVLFAMIGTIGNPVIVVDEPDFAIKNVALFKVPKDQSSAFLKYYLDSNFVVSKMEKEAKGTTQKFVGLNYLRSFPISMPQLSEQKRIVAILDQVFEGINKAIENTERNLASARELFESYLHKIFRQNVKLWGEESLGDVTKFKGGGTPSKKVAEYWIGEIPWVSPKDMKFAVVDKSIDQINSLAIENSSASIIPKNSILIVVRSGILSRTIPLALTGCELAINQDLKAIIPSNKIKSEYLYYFLKSKQNFILEKVSRGATVHRISAGDLKDIRIHVPKLSEQKNIVRKCETVSKHVQDIEEIYKQKLWSLLELKQSILQKAFADELRVKENQEEVAA